MKKKSSNYIVIIMVLLLVVVIIMGAGLCYLSWARDYSQMAETNTTEVVMETQDGTQEPENMESAKEEGRQEVIDAIKEDLAANVSAEEIVSELIGEQTTEPEITTEIFEEEGLASNTVTMDDITINKDGTYQYTVDGKVISHKGIDVSKYQGNIDWSKVKADGVEYAFLRVGCRGYGKNGTLIHDENFKQNIKDALAEDIKVGAYFFSQAITKEEAEEEAKLVVDALKGYEIAYPVAIDIERVDDQKARQDALTKEERTEICITFCEYIKNAGYIPMVYGDLDTFSELLDAEKLAGYEFWICETDGKMTFPYEFSVWQYSHTGKVDGIKVDTNYSISMKTW